MLVGPSIYGGIRGEMSTSLTPNRPTSNSLNWLQNVDRVPLGPRFGSFSPRPLLLRVVIVHYGNCMIVVDLVFRFSFTFTRLTNDKVCVFYWIKLTTRPIDLGVHGYTLNTLLFLLTVSKTYFYWLPQKRVGRRRHRRPSITTQRTSGEEWKGHLDLHWTVLFVNILCFYTSWSPCEASL